MLKYAVQACQRSIRRLAREAHSDLNDSEKRPAILDADEPGLLCGCWRGERPGFRLTPLMAALLGMLTDVGGGVAREVLLAKIPAVFGSDLYAVAALAGVGIVVEGSELHVPVLAATVCGGLVCFALGSWQFTEDGDCWYGRDH
jgi:uncharacterized membrane protein YeiH